MKDVFSIPASSTETSAPRPNPNDVTGTFVRENSDLATMQGIEILSEASLDIKDMVLQLQEEVRRLGNASAQRSTQRNGPEDGYELMATALRDGRAKATRIEQLTQETEYLRQRNRQLEDIVRQHNIPPSSSNRAITDRPLSSDRRHGTTEPVLNPNGKRLRQLDNLTLTSSPENNPPSFYTNNPGGVIPTNSRRADSVVHTGLVNENVSISGPEEPAQPWQNATHQSQFFQTPQGLQERRSTLRTATNTTTTTSRDQTGFNGGLEGRNTFKRKRTSRKSEPIGNQLNNPQKHKASRNSTQNETVVSLLPENEEIMEKNNVDAADVNIGEGVLYESAQPGGPKSRNTPTRSSARISRKPSIQVDTRPPTASVPISGWDENTTQDRNRTIPPSSQSAGDNAHHQEQPRPQVESEHQLTGITNAGNVAKGTSSSNTREKQEGRTEPKEHVKRPRGRPRQSVTAERERLVKLAMEREELLESRN